MAQSVSGFVDQQIPGLVATYQQLHAAPELSHHEEKTSAFLAAELRKAGLTNPLMDAIEKVFLSAG